MWDLIVILQLTLYVLKNMYLHFMSFIHFDMTRAIEIPQDKNEAKASAKMVFIMLNRIHSVPAR